MQDFCIFPVFRRLQSDLSVDDRPFESKGTTKGMHSRDIQAKVVVDWKTQYLAKNVPLKLCQLSFLFVLDLPIFFISSIFRIYYQNTYCSNIVQDCLWYNVRPRVVLRNGFFQKAECGFEMVQSIDASGIGLNEVFQKISLFENVERISLANNHMLSSTVSMINLSQL